MSRSSFSANPEGYDGSDLSLNVMLQECPGYDTGDYREGIAECLFSDGTKALSFHYEGYQIVAGKPGLTGLPSTRVESDDEADTLVIKMRDPFRKILAELSYTIYRFRPVITRSIKYHNESQTLVMLNKALSACVDFDRSDFDMVQMPGEWADEKHLQRNRIHNGIHMLDSKRGASGIVQPPFIALMQKNAQEYAGEVFGFHLVYSGNFKITTEVDAFQQTRVLIGINEFNFSWRLMPSASFQTPEVVMVYSNSGLNGMSQAYHHLYLERLSRSMFRHEPRPVLINNWETTYFDFTESKLHALIERAQSIGAELFVLDDGWFGHRDDDTSSLGDWVVDKQKLPQGLKALSDYVHKCGMKFGLWFEPEMISQNSQLFSKHPDWHIHVQDYPASIGRHQMILDYSRQEVRDAIYQQMITILDTVPIDYIKWDMNRNMTEIGSAGRCSDAQMETAHRYILGLYDILEKITTRYPEILFENCSGGAGRFDPGMLYYMPQSWSSDNTDALERFKIQYATSVTFPPVMMCAQLSESPNAQVDRITDVAARANVSMSANFGIMMDLTQKNQKQLAELSAYITEYKKNRELIQYGDFYRLMNPFTGNYGCWQFVSENQRVSRVVFLQALAHASKPWVRVQLHGLNDEAIYQLDNGLRLSGDELMKFGLYLNQDLHGDFKTKTVTLTQID